VTGCKFEVALSEAAKTKLRQDLETSTQNALNNMKSLIDVSKSESYLPQDREMIFNAIRSQGKTMNELNSVVFKCLQASITHICERDHDKCRLHGKNDILRIETINCLAGVYENQGMYDKAQSLVEQFYKMSKTVLGEKHPDTLIYKSKLAI
jgi:phosphoribosylaminoimidazole-succinocarboxamide synthase